MLTYRTTRPVKCIYFDGASAALNTNMDSQMVFIHNSSANVPDHPQLGRPGGNLTGNDTSGVPRRGILDAEYNRAEALCAYIKENNLGGRGWGYEGIVRMNAGFELIWCDFSSPSARLVSNLNISIPFSFSGDGNFRPPPYSGRPSGPYGPLSPPMTDLSPFDRSAELGWLQATVNQYGFSSGMPGRGEIRVRPDSCGIFTFYDAELADQEHARMVRERQTYSISSTGTWKLPKNESERDSALQAMMRRRRYHRAENVSAADGLHMRKAVKQRLGTFLDERHGCCSGIDWRSTTQEIVMTYSTPLLLLARALKKLSPAESVHQNETWVRESLSEIRGQTHQLMMPYYIYPPEDTIKRSVAEAFSKYSPGAQELYLQCRHQHAPFADLARSEQQIYTAIYEVLGSICHVLSRTFLGVEAFWFSHFEDGIAVAELQHNTDKFKAAATAWRHDLEELMAWLGWADQWTTCDPDCGMHQVCSIPIWPLPMTFRSGPDGPPQRPPSGNETYPGYGDDGKGPHRWPGPDNKAELWEPRCINRTEFV
ncbi:hypothetical protein H2203_006056 [Taxawa tesnikishii (nom. ined.)]|nr:hypothetical protein H2203_006056 [Dothideales sp. JES 119]